MGTTITFEWVNIKTLSNGKKRLDQRVMIG